MYAERQLWANSVEFKFAVVLFQDPVKARKAQWDYRCVVKAGGERT